MRFYPLDIQNPLGEVIVFLYLIGDKASVQQLTQRVLTSMANASRNCNASSARIDCIDSTDETLTGRAGMVLFSRYLQGIRGLFPRLERLFGSIRKSGKGLPVVVLFKQVFCFLLDGTSCHLTHFDALKAEAGYASAIETRPEQMASSHAVKRFFYAFSWPLIWRFRRLLQQLFIWRLRLATPPVVVLNIDTMVMDNDEATERHGVEPTYKKVKGFQPLQVTWRRFVIDAVFRGGAKHSNSGDTALKAIAHLVRRIRRDYREEVPIIVRMDSGFFDQKLFEVCEDLGIGYICAGRLLGEIKEFVSALPPSAFEHYRSGEQVWEYVELGDCRGTWECFRRALFIRPRYDEAQQLLAFVRPETILYTNLGRGERIDELLEAAGCAHWSEAEHLIACYHERGADELVHRVLKEFRAEQLPFKRFAPNAAFYFCALVAFFLYEAFKEDVTAPVVPVASYPTRLRRAVIDIAGKIVRTGRQVILKVTRATFSRLSIDELWSRTANPPRLCMA